MTLHDAMSRELIVSDPDIALGKPVVAGTRITVEHILEELAGGATPEDLLAAHPHLTIEGVRAALRYALEVLRSDRIYPSSDTSS